MCGLPFVQRRRRAGGSRRSRFALACLAGGGAVRGVAPTLHSPLMSLTNAISGLTVAERPKPRSCSP